MIEAAGGYITTVIYLGAGAAAAVMHLALIWLTAAALVRRRAMTPLLLGSVTRLGFLVSLVLAAYWARIEPLELFGALAGFLIVRSIVLRAVPGATQQSRPGSHLWR